MDEDDNVGAWWAAEASGEAGESSEDTSLSLASRIASMVLWEGFRERRMRLCDKDVDDEDDNGDDDDEEDEGGEALGALPLLTEEEDATWEEVAEDSSSCPGSPELLPLLTLAIARLPLMLLSAPLSIVAVAPPGPVEAPAWRPVGVMPLLAMSARRPTTPP